MSDIADSAQPRPRRRADAERSVAAILDSAARVLARDPQASMAAIAKAAGTSRQTVYVHFSSREVLLGALVERATARVVAELDAADLDSIPAGEALLRLLEIGWHAVEMQPFLLLPGPPRTAAEDLELHQPVLVQFERQIRRGRREGDFDHTQSVSWMLAAFMALGHAAGGEVHSGRMSFHKAHTVLQQAITRLFAA